MSRVPEDTVGHVREHVDIVDVVAEYVVLKPAGRDRFKGLCPFHDEKTPSFHVDRQKQFFYCFGCQVGGDVFNFVMNIEKADFREALTRLAERAGIPAEALAPSPEAAERQRAFQRMLEVVEAACVFFQEQLKGPVGKKARQYMANRGITPEVAETFRLGYAPPGWQNLTEHFTTSGVDMSLAIEVGLTGQGRRGPYDRFRDRLMFPITDVRGRVVAFGGRALSPEDVKYINSPESTLYVKRHHLYALSHVVATPTQEQRTGRVATQRRHDRAAEARLEDAIILVEGYTDVTALYEAGFRRSVASLGTALTTEQAALLARFTQRVIIAYDADAAGDTATWRGLDLLAEAGLDVRVAVLPQGEDPDSFVKKNRDGFLQSCVDGLPLYEYKIGSVLKGVDTSTVTGKIEGTEKVVPVLADIEHAVAREGYVQWTADLLGVSFQALAHEVGRFIDARGRQRGQNRASQFTTTGRTSGRAKSSSTALSDNGEGKGRSGPEIDDIPPLSYDPGEAPPPMDDEWVDERGGQRWGDGAGRGQRFRGRRRTPEANSATGRRPYRKTVPPHQGPIRHKMSTARYTIKDSAQSAYDSACHVLACVMERPELATAVRHMLGDEAPFIDRRQNEFFKWLLAQGNGDAKGELLIDKITDADMAMVAQHVWRSRMALDAVGPFEAYVERAMFQTLKAQVGMLEARLEQLVNEEWMTLQEINALLLEFKSLHDRMSVGVASDVL